MKVNRTELANFLDIAETTVDRWVAREGCPIENRPGQGKAASFDSGKVVRWWIQRELDKAESRTGGDDLDALRARKIEVETQMKQLQLAKEKSEVCSLEQAQLLFSTIVIHCRAQLLALPQRLVPLLLGETNETRLKKVINDEIRQALTDLSQSAVDDVLKESSEW